MPPHSVASATIAFGLVAIPVKLYAAAAPAGIAFHMLHAECGTRIRQQRRCPTCDCALEWNELVRGYEVAKDSYVRVTDDELKALEASASKEIAIDAFVPLHQVDPVYFDATYYLGPDKGGDTPYRLLADAMATRDLVAIATFVLRGRSHVAVLRAAQGGLQLHTLHFVDEVRPFAEIPTPEASAGTVRPAELALAGRLIDGLATDKLALDRYRDEYRERVLELVNAKIEGRQITVAPAAPARAVPDLQEALTASLAKLPGVRRMPLAKAGAARPAARARARAGKR
jgi:DNA end-binding protein Ku